MKRSKQHELVDRSSTKRAFVANSPSEGKRYTITSAAVRSCLYERKQPVSVDVYKLRRQNFEGFNKKLCRLLCKIEYSVPCPLHGLHHSMLTHKALQESRAVRSLPPEVSFCRSSVPGTELGVSTRKHLPAGTWIGPFEGRRIRPEEVKLGMDTSYMWEVGVYCFTISYTLLCRQPGGWRFTISLWVLYWSNERLSGTSIKKIVSSMRPCYNSWRLSQWLFKKRPVPIPWWNQLLHHRLPTSVP